MTQLLTLSLPHRISNICRLSRVFYQLIVAWGKVDYFQIHPGIPLQVQTLFYLYLCTAVSQAGFLTGRGNHVCMLVGDRELHRARAGSSPSLCLSLLNLSGVRWRQKQQIPTVPTCYSHTFRKSPRNYQWTFLNNGSIQSFISAAPLFTPKAVVGMKG